MKQDLTQNLLTISQASAALGLDEAVIRSLIKDGYLTGRSTIYPYELFVTTDSVQAVIRQLVDPFFAEWIQQVQRYYSKWIGQFTWNGANFVNPE